MQQQLQSLLSCSAMVDNDPKMTPLIRAVLSNDVDTVHSLLRRGSGESPNHRLSCGLNALMCAVQRRNPAMIRALCHQGNVEICAKVHGVSPLDWALVTEQPEVVDIMLYGEKTPKPAKANKTLRPLARAVVELLGESRDRRDGTLDMVLLESALTELGYDPMSVDLVDLARHMENLHDSIVFHGEEGRGFRGAVLCDSLVRLTNIQRVGQEGPTHFLPEDLPAVCSQFGGWAVASRIAEAFSPEHLGDFARFPCPVLLRADCRLAHLFLHRGGSRISCAIVDISNRSLEIRDVNDAFLVDIVKSARHNILCGTEEFVAFAFEIGSESLLVELVGRHNLPESVSFETLREMYISDVLRPATSVMLSRAKRNSASCYAMFNVVPHLAKVFYTTVDKGDAATMSQVLVASSFHGHLAFTSSVMQDGGDLNRVDDRSGWTPLTAAVHGNQPQQLAALLRVGADSRIPQANGLAPLYLACEMGHTVAASILLSAGAAVEQSDAQGFTPLMAAIRAKNVSLVHKLIAFGADVSAVSQVGVTPLLASSWILPEVTTVLLHHGALPYGKCKGSPNVVLSDLPLTIHDIADALRAIKRHIDPGVVTTPGDFPPRCALPVSSCHEERRALGYVEHLTGVLTQSEGVLMEVAHDTRTLSSICTRKLLVSWRSTLVSATKTLLRLSFSDRDSESDVDEIIGLLETSHARGNRVREDPTAKPWPFSPSLWVLPVELLVQHLKGVAKYPLWNGWRAVAIEHLLDPTSSGLVTRHDYYTFLRYVHPIESGVNAFCVFAENGSFLPVCSGQRAAAILDGTRRGAYVVCLTGEATKPFVVFYTTVMKEVAIYHPPKCGLFENLDVPVFMRLHEHLMTLEYCKYPRGRLYQAPKELNPT